MRFLQNCGGNNEDKRLLTEFTMITSDFNGKIDLSQWFTNKYLPTGWKCKPNGNVILLKNPEGKVAHSYRQAMKLMVEDGRYSKEEMKRLHQYPDGGKMYKLLIRGKKHNLKNTLSKKDCFKKPNCNRELIKEPSPGLWSSC